MNSKDERNGLLRVRAIEERSNNVADKVQKSPFEEKLICTAESSD